jgi:hypothetical protein
MNRTMRRLAAWCAPLLAAGAVAWLAGGTGGDSSRFVGPGETLLSSHWGDAFASKYTQAGPLQLALFGSIGRSDTALAIVLALLATLALLAASEAVGVRSPAVTALLGLFAVHAGFTRVGYTWGHPADAVLPLAWVVAAVQARRGHALLAGALVGLTTGLETWGILGVAALALAPRWRDAGRGALVAAGVAAGLFLPFVLGGHFAMWQYHWPVRHPSFLSLFIANGTPFGWPLRLLQGAASVGAGVATARTLRASPHAPWVVALATVSARLLLDPLYLPYYRAAVDGPVLVGAALLAARLTAPRTAADPHRVGRLLVRRLRRA